MNANELFCIRVYSRFVAVVESGSIRRENVRGGKTNCNV